jgi:hypothetical protein
MAYTKIFNTPLAGGKSAYVSVILTNKITELHTSQDLTTTYEVLPDGTAKCVQVWKDEAAYNSFISWLGSSGELSKMQAYHAANNITPIVS